MRILHINCNYIGTTLHQIMIEKLDALGIENEVFVPTYDKDIAVIDVNKNVSVVECFNKRDRYLFDYKQAKIIKAIEQHYDVKNFDLIHAYTLFTDGNAARVLSSKYGVPYVVAVRNTDVNDFFRLMIHLRGRGLKTMLAAKNIFFLSEAYKKQVLNKYISPKVEKKIVDKISVIPNGIDDFWFANKPEIKNTSDRVCWNLVYAGGLDRNKNITTTQKAMEILRADGIETHLTVVGKIVQQDVYEEVMKDEYTSYIPAQPKENLIEIYRDNDIFVMPSIYESFGLVYAEAMSQGLPVVYSQGQGFDHQFEEGVAGFHVNAEDPGDVADGIKRIIANYNAIHKNVPDLSKKFGWENLVRQYEQIYKCICE